ncbi:hypothetical protein QE452_000317 [Sphingomonas sp. SORGH_AS438]|nr:hypothetical protein [Sphingomonas sp. SORGH_AS_0438]
MLAAISSIEADASSAAAAWFGRALRDLLGGGGELLAARRDGIRRVGRIADDRAQPLHHRDQRMTQLVTVGQRLVIDGQVALGDRLGQRGGGAQILGHAVDGADQIADLVV